jgi:hypothetical protein
VLIVVLLSSPSLHLRITAGWSIAPLMVVSSANVFAVVLTKSSCHHLVRHHIAQAQKPAVWPTRACRSADLFVFGVRAGYARSVSLASRSERPTAYLGQHTISVSPLWTDDVAVVHADGQIFPGEK